MFKITHRIMLTISLSLHPPVHQERMFHEKGSRQIVATFSQVICHTGDHNLRQPITQMDNDLLQEMPNAHQVTSVLGIEEFLIKNQSIQSIKIFTKNSLAAPQFLH